MLENINKSFYAKDLSIEEWETAADRLGALAFSDPLGAAIIRSTATNKQIGDVISSLAKKIGWKEPNKVLRIKIASLAIIEYIFKNCRPCNGNGTGRTEIGLLIECPKCSGAGTHRYTDKQRSTFLKAEWTPRLAIVLDYAQTYLSGAQSSTLNEVKRQLERD